MKNTGKGVFFVLLSAFLWGLLPLISRFVYAEGISSVTAAAMRSYIAAIIFFVWFLISGDLKKLKLIEVPFYLAFGFSGVAGTCLFYMMAVEMVSTAMASILLYTAPAFVIILSRIFYKEDITPAKLAALVMTIGGCCLVVKLYDPASFRTDLLGILIGLASGAAYSLVTILGRKGSQYHDSRLNTGYMMILGVPVFLVIAPPTSIPFPTPKLWIAYILLALVGSVFPYMSYLKGVENLGDGGIASILATAEPVVATLVCAAVYGDRLELLQILGVAVVILGISLPILLKRKPEEIIQHDVITTSE